MASTIFLAQSSTLQTRTQFCTKFTHQLCIVESARRFFSKSAPRMLHTFKPKIPIWVNIVCPRNWKTLEYFGQLVVFTARCYILGVGVWCILWSFDAFSPFWYVVAWKFWQPWPHERTYAVTWRTFNPSRNCKKTGFQQDHVFSIHERCHPGWTDWANFRPIRFGLVLAVFLEIYWSSPHFGTTFFLSIHTFDKKMGWTHFFQKLIWSLCCHPSQRLDISFLVKAFGRMEKFFSL
jgi:hypothetical protein